VTVRGEPIVESTEYLNLRQFDALHPQLIDSVFRALHQIAKLEPVGARQLWTKTSRG
jgi:hypothetical protein